MTITKKTTLQDRAAIAQTSDGKCKIYSLKDPASADGLVYGNAWSGVSKDLMPSYGGDKWYAAEAKLTLGSGAPIPYEMTITPAADGATFAVTRKDGVTDPEVGTYPNASLTITVRSDAGTEYLAIPSKVTVAG